MTLDPRDRDLIIRTVIGEAAQEPFEGQAGVAHVIRNRLNAGNYGGSVPSVLFAPKQFEPWNTRRSELMSYAPESPVYQRTGQVVDMVFGGQFEDPTRGALNFANVDTVRARGNNAGMNWINNMQANGSAVKIGNHTFGTPGQRPGASQPARGPRFELLDDDTQPSRKTGGGVYAQSSAEELQGFLDNPRVPLNLKNLMREELAARPAAGAQPTTGDPMPQGRFELLDDEPAASSNGGWATRAQRETAEPVSVIEAAGRGLAQGASLGFSDEMAGAAAASPLPGPQAPVAIPNALDSIAGGVRMLAEKVAPSLFGDNGGQAYEREVTRRREELAQAREQQPVAAYGGELLGGAVIPLGVAGQAATRGQAAVQGARAGAVGGALYGAGQGEDLQGRATGAATGAAVGGVLGGTIGGALGPRAAASAQVAGPAAQDVAAAAERAGVNVPKAIATDSLALQRAAQGARNVPFAGEPLVRATGEMVEGLGRAADDVATGMGSGDRAQAGAVATSAIRDWITGKSAAAVNKAYDDVERVVDPAIRTDLASTRQVVAEIAARRQNARIQGESRAINEVLPAVQEPGGLNFAGIKDLRTRIGELQKGGLLPSDISGSELKRLYGALSTDLRDAATNAGGQRGLQLFERANKFNAAVQTRREELAKIVGANGDAPAEAVFDKLARYAGEKGGADISRLAKARNAIGQDWDEVVSGVVARMGRDAEGNFTPDRFVTAWGNLSPAGKSVLFSNSAHRAALEDIFTISSRAKDVYKKFGNPSGTAQNVGFAAGGAGLLADPVTTIGTVLGANVLSRVLAQPATASSMARWSRVYQGAVTKPTAATAATLQVATRNLASTIGDQIGVRVLPQELLRAVAGPRMSPASDSQTDQEE